MPSDIAPRQHADHGYNTIILAVYIVVAGLGALTHQMWRDEMQAWLIARDSATPWAIIANLRYDGHPALWYFVLWPITRLTWHPDAMKLASLASAIAGVALFLWHGPWSRLEKALWPFGFYILFEYGVKSRGYNLGVFLLMAFCALWPYRRTRILSIALVLGLLANVHIYFGILAGAGALALAVDRWQTAGWRGLRPSPRDVAAGMLIGGLALFAAFVAAPPAQGDFSTALPIHWASVIAGLGKIIIPASFLVDIGAPGAVPSLVFFPTIGIAAMLTAACWYGAYRRPAAIAFHLLAMLPLLLFFTFLYPVDTHHAGLILLALTGGEWLRRQLPATPRACPRAAGKDRPFLSALFAIALVGQAASGVVAVVFHLLTPYSNARQVAAFVREQGWGDDAVAGIGGPLTAVCGYLQKRWCLYAERDQKNSYFVFNGQPGTISNTNLSPDALGRLAAQAAALGPAVLFVIPSPWPDHPDIMARSGFQRIRAFTGATIENYVVYRKHP